MTFAAPDSPIQMDRRVFVCLDGCPVTSYHPIARTARACYNCGEHKLARVVNRDRMMD